MADVAKFEKQLLARKKELEQRLQGIEHDLDEPMSKDIEDRATEREGDEVLESMGNVGLDELEAIDAALERVKKGTFGDCVSCGEPVSEARLETVPTATLCRNCM
ncbi:MAG: TraR/DksA family transcriptional regulator [Rhizobiales bacterium]|nr:TraR/DksA family transcriptional regulator [Hyphomicrobiales bacterium]